MISWSVVTATGMLTGGHGTSSSRRPSAKESEDVSSMIC